MSRTKKFIQNTLASVVQEIIVLLAGLITPRIMLYYYGSEINGLIASLTQFFSYIGLVEAGLSGAAVYGLYAPLASNNYAKINAVMSAIKRFYAKSGYFFVTLSVILAAVYPLFIKTDRVTFMECSILTLILGVNGCIDFFTLGKYRALLTADQSIRIISYGNSLHYLLNVCITYVGAYLGWNIVLLKAVGLLSIFARTLILVLYCRRKYSYLDCNVVPDYAALEKRWNAFFLQILGIVQNATPIVIITVVIQDLKMASVYAIYTIVTSGIGSVLGMFINGLASSFGDVIVRKEVKILQAAYSQFETVYYIILTIIAAISFATIQPFVNLYTKGITDINYNLPYLGFLTVLNLLLYNIKTPQGMLVISAGHYKETRWQSTTQALIIIIFGIPFSYYYGIYGVMYGLILSNIYRDIDLMFYIPLKVTHTKVINTLRRIIRIGICSVIILTIERVFLHLSVTSWYQWIEHVFLVGVLAIIITLCINFLFDRNILVGVYDRIKGL